MDDNALPNVPMMYTAEQKELRQHKIRVQYDLDAPNSRAPFAPELLRPTNIAAPTIVGIRQNTIGNILSFYTRMLAPSSSYIS